MSRSDLMRNFRKTHLIMFFSAFLLGSSYAKSIDGYIIKLDSTLVVGKIKTNSYNLYSKGYIFNGIPLDAYHTSVGFKGENDKRFHFYKPNEILGFCFKYRTVEYRFQSFTISAKSMVKKDRMQHRFLLLIYEGEINLYRDIAKIITEDNNSWNYTNEYYINSKTVGLSRVVSTKANPELKDLLSKYAVDNNYLNTIPEQLEFRKIQTILREYDIWIRKKDIENRVY